MRKFITNKITLTCIGILLILLIWQIISMAIDRNSLIFPTPFETLKRVIELLSISYTYKCIFESLFKVVIGFIISIVLSIIFGCISGNNSQIETILKPFITLLKSIPTASLVFLFLIISGAKYAPIYIVVLLSFPILYESIVGGIKNIDKNIINAVSLDCKKSFYSLIRIKLPLALPYFLVGLASSFALSFKVEIMAEIISGSTSNGLGAMIYYYSFTDPSNMINIFAYSFIAIFLALLFSFVSFFTTKFIKR